jgi:UDPglucose 6-dehydrogenase
MKVGLIGNGWVGRNIANEMEARGFQITRYDLLPPLNENKAKMAEMDIVFIAVPTPPAEEGPDYSIVEEALNLLSPGATVVIKSTMLPGVTENFQAKYDSLNLIHCPEFLAEKTASHDAKFPARNILGLSQKTYAKVNSEEEYPHFDYLLKLLPQTCATVSMSATAAEMVKHASNAFLFQKVLFFNMIYDLCQKMEVNFSSVKTGIMMDPRIGTSHTTPVDDSGKRGAGGHCFVKDFAAFAAFVEAKDNGWRDILGTMEIKNLQLLLSTGKDIELAKQAYGDGVELMIADLSQ